MAHAPLRLDEPPATAGGERTPAAPARTGAPRDSTAAQNSAAAQESTAAQNSTAAPDSAAAAAGNPAGGDAATQAIERLLQRLEGRGFDAKLAAIERERREAPELVDELLALPEPRRSAAAASSRYATPEVVWRLLEVSRDALPPSALEQLAQARKIAIHLVALQPGATLHVQLRVEVSCEMAHRLLDCRDLAAAAARLEAETAALTPDLGYARALYCRALARLRSAERRWDEALALGDRAVRLLEAYGSDAEQAAATVELGWLLLEAGEADEAVPLFEQALPAVEAIPYPAVTCRLGLAIGLLESGQAAGSARIESLLADAEWMIGRAGAAGDQPRLRWLATQAAARCRRATG
ncbi:MAG: tetratricopeptide repeat protein [Acidobacteria bacterium]|nr:tetratricopeptide repeat protein [Acidobacteriota bacterium]